MDWERHFRQMKRNRQTVSFGADYGFGVEARGVQVPGVTNGAVIPPGRYWLDAFGDKVKTFQDYLTSKPEIQVETTEQDPNADPAHTFTIFVVPPTANNYGIAGVFFPTVSLGFPEIADASVTTSDDTVKKPPPPTSTDILADAAGALGKAGGAAASGAAGMSDTTTLLKVGAAAAVALIVLKKLAFL